MRFMPPYQIHSVSEAHHQHRWRLTFCAKSCKCMRLGLTRGRIWKAKGAGKASFENRNALIHSGHTTISNLHLDVAELLNLHVLTCQSHVHLITFIV